MDIIPEITAEPSSNARAHCDHCRDSNVSLIEICYGRLTDRCRVRLCQDCAIALATAIDGAITLQLRALDEGESSRFNA